MNFKLLKQLPRIQRPRTGRLKDLPRSAPDLTSHEEAIAQEQFNLYTEVDQAEEIMKEEIKSILLNLNIQMTD